MIDPVEIFRQEADEHLALIEDALLALEQSPGNETLIATLFRSVHTIKGSAGMVGFESVSAFAHHLETFLDQVRNGVESLTPDRVSALLKGRDHLERLMRDDRPDEGVQRAGDEVLSALGASGSTDGETVEPDDMNTALPGQAVIYRLAVCPDTGAFRDGFDVIPVLRELHALGSCHVEVELVADEADEPVDPETCHLRFAIELETTAPRDEIEAVFLFVEADWAIEIEVVAEATRGSGPAGEDDPAKAAQSGTGSELAVEASPGAGVATEQTIRVAQSKLDALMDQVGELLILQSRLEQTAIERGDESLASVAEEMGRLTDGLRETAFDVRMLPIGTIFGRFRRLVRDLGTDLGKDVRLMTEGEDTELDKVVIDRLADPLIHLIRNSLDHGIESPADRVGRDKSPRGTLRLAAGQHQGRIRITLSDDGAGLDRDAILVRAVERGLVDPEAMLADHEVHQLIFEPGFSTAREISDVSGRGVGMDVVKRSIEQLRGRVAIESVPGDGTTIRIDLPMTLAIIDGLMVGVGEERYVLPLSMVEECIETTYADEKAENGARLVRHRDELIPCLRLRETFSIPNLGARPPIEQTVLVRAGDERIGITVDQVVGNFQTVIKGLGSLYRDVRGVLGATIMGDGRIAMILDVDGLLAPSEQQSKS